MTLAAPASWAQRMRHHLRSWTLRRRLVLAVVAIIALLGAVIGLVSVLFLRGYLESRLDDQLNEAATRGSLVAGQSLAAAGEFPPIDHVVGGPGQSPGTFAAFIDSNENITAGYLSRSADPHAATPGTDYRQRLLALSPDDPPTTIDLGGDLGPYRVMAVSLPRGAELVVGLPLTDVEATTGRLAFIILVVTVLALVLAGGAGLLIVRLALRPLNRVAGAATAVSELPLDRGDVALAVRVPEEDTNPNTEVGRVGAALNRMLGHVGAALTARQNSEQKVRQFVADASHELRTPLASIRGYAELTRRSPHELPPDVVRAIGRVESEATRMTSLVEDLLLLARLDEGRDLRREEVDLTSMLIDAVGDAHAAGPEHHWSLDLPEEPVEVIGDRARLQQVVVNLLANARVHTPPGTHVTASVSRQDEHALITIADDGPGIAPELQPALFERFSRGDESRSRATGSTGLGLAIVHAVVEAHGGQVTVASEPGATSFTVRLPIGARLDADQGKETV